MISELTFAAVISEHKRSISLTLLIRHTKREILRQQEQLSIMELKVDLVYQRGLGTGLLNQH